MNTTVQKCSDEVKQRHARPFASFDITARHSPFSSSAQPSARTKSKTDQRTRKASERAARLRPSPPSAGAEGEEPRRE